MSLLLLTVSVQAQERQLTESYVDVCEDWARQTRILQRFPWAVETNQCPFMDDASTRAQLIGELPSPPGSEFLTKYLLDKEATDCTPESISSLTFNSCFPEIAAVYGAGICSGTLVAPGVVLTARHCAPADEVGFGSSLDTPIRYSVVATIPHPDRRVDIALLVLDEAPAIAPLIWRTSSEEQPPPQDVRLFASGFGKSRPGGSLSLKWYTELGVIDPEWGCPYRLARVYGCRPNQELTAFAFNPGQGGDTCPGDSGGPLLEPIGDGWRVVGVTLRGTRGAVDECGEGGIYQRMDLIADWMTDEIRRISVLYF